MPDYLCCGNPADILNLLFTSNGGPSSGMKECATDVLNLMADLVLMELMILMNVRGKEVCMVKKINASILRVDKYDKNGQ